MFNRARARVLFTLALPLLLAGCGETHEKHQAEAKNTTAAKPKKSESEAEAEIEKCLARLSPEDRKLAEAQRFCAHEEGNRLGSMGPPFKVMIHDKPVFLCCGACKKKALAQADKTLAKAEELTKKSAEAAK